MDDDETAVAVVIAIVAGAVLFLSSSASAARDAVADMAPSTSESDGENRPYGFDPLTGEDEVVEPGNTADEGEVGTVDVEGAGDTLYDDPETGPANDEPGDDQNATFEDTQTVLDATGSDLTIEPETYAPDVEGGSTAPSDETNVLADAGTSQNYGSAPEQENDDLTERAADSNLSPDLKSSFDQLANYDDPDNL